MEHAIVKPKMTPEVFAEKMTKWAAASATLAEAKETEMSLRKELFAELFAAPKEGTNYAELAGGWKAKGEFKLTRKLDIALLGSMRERLASVGASIDTLVRYKPELDIPNYRALSPATLAIFDEMVTTTPGAPTLELIPPKGKKA